MHEVTTPTPTPRSPSPARLFSAPWVVPVTRPPIREGAVALDAAGTVLAVGTRAQLRAAFAGATEARGEGALMPGLVNAHTHLELSWLGGAVSGGDGVVAWTRRLAERLAAAVSAPGASPSHSSDADADGAALAAALAARRLGTAALGDVGNGTAGWRAMAQAGLGGLFFHELVGSRERRTGDALADAARERAAVPEAERPADVAAVAAPHAPYSVGPDLMRRIFAAARAADRPTTIHLAEDADELALLQTGGGAWPAVLRAMGVAPEERVPHLAPCAYLDSLGAFATAAAPPPLLVHMVHAAEDDRRRARAARATVVLCPRSNLHIGGRLPDVRALFSDGVRLAVGTDSLASAPDLSLWAELHTLARALPELPARVWLEAGTAGGARALGLRHLGAIEPGCRPGLLDVLIAADARDPERALVDNPTPSPRWLAPAATS